MDAALFAIDRLTGELRFVDAPDFERPRDTGSDNVYDVLVEVNDGTWVDLQTISVSVTGVDESPAITSNGGGATAEVSVAENSSVVTTVTAVDPDAGAILTYSILGGEDAGLFAIDETTGELNFRAAPNFESSRAAQPSTVVARGSR